MMLHLRTFAESVEKLSQKKSKCNNDLKVLLGSCLFIYGFFPCGVDALSKTELDPSSDYVGYLKVV